LRERERERKRKKKRKRTRKRKREIAECDESVKKSVSEKDSVFAYICVFLACFGRNRHISSFSLLYYRR
jgi:hypothetical protein